MTINAIHIISKHRVFGEDCNNLHFAHREIDEYLCGLMSFNDEYSEKDGSNFYKTAMMYMMTEKGIKKYVHGGIHVPMVMYNMVDTTEKDFCDLCRYNFYKMKGLLLSSGMWDSMCGKNFEPQIVREQNAK